MLTVPENEYEPPLPNIFSMHWFLTLFSTCLPRDCVLRVWDALMLQGSEILLRTAIALWSRMSRRILRTSSADEFYTLMGKLCKELAEMNQEEQDHIMTVIYTMAEFPYPGLAELREKHRWNIQPLSNSFKSGRRSADDILHKAFISTFNTKEYEELIASEESTFQGNIRRKIDNWNNLRFLEKQFRLAKQRQKQAAVIINNAYLHSSKARMDGIKSLPERPVSVPMSQSVFNHLVIGPVLARGDCWNDHLTTLTGGALQLAATVIQPLDHSAHVSRSSAGQPNLPFNRYVVKKEGSYTASSDK
ncbi:unnamed protein product [Haemonchus placei]|uniref:Rab-GAP TBC domain-containing protein n=1 Tax=Haemonchus placei TaxID=6290 RepID=A0A158QJY6_HAEPC|nr:unnamed protein product [Haemonchus placei]